MKPLHVDDVRSLIPEVDALRPLMDLVLATARSDRDRRWAASGELGTLGGRLVDPGEIERALPELLDSVRSHLEGLYGAVVASMEAQARAEPEGAMRALQWAAELEQGVGRIQEAGAFIEAALALAGRVRDRRHVVPALLSGARIARAGGRWKEAEARYREAGEVAAAVGDATSAAQAAVGWGNIAVDRGLWAVALKRYGTAERWVREAEGPLPEAWHLALNRSIVARREGRLEEADKELERARTLAGEGEEGGAEAGSILDNAYGQILQARGRHEEAELAYRRALDRAEAADAIVTISSNLADSLLAQGRALEAGEVVRRAEEIALRHAVLPRLPELYTLMGRVAELRGHPDAFVFFERALQIVTERGLPDFERARVLQAYGVYELKRNETETGNAFLSEAEEIFRELGHDAARRQVAGLRDGNGGEERDDGE